MFHEHPCAKCKCICASASNTILKLMIKWENNRKKSFCWELRHYSNWVNFFNGFLCKCFDIFMTHILPSVNNICCSRSWFLYLIWRFLFSNQRKMFQDKRKPQCEGEREREREKKINILLTLFIDSIDNELRKSLLEASMVQLESFQPRAWQKLFNLKLLKLESSWLNNSSSSSTSLIDRYRKKIYSNWHSFVYLSFTFWIGSKRKVK